VELVVLGAEVPVDHSWRATVGAGWVVEWLMPVLVAAEQADRSWLVMAPVLVARDRGAEVPLQEAMHSVAEIFIAVSLAVEDSAAVEDGDVVVLAVEDLAADLAADSDEGSASAVSAGVLDLDLVADCSASVLAFRSSDTDLASVSVTAC
jgi:hypothetical protein